MDFAPEPVLDAFTPPPRATPRAPAADDNGQTFDDHLDAVSAPAPERPAPARNEAKDETPPVDAKPTEDTEASDETIDPEVALLGGPLPAAPPPMAAPVVVQIAASQSQQTQAETESQSGDTNLAPVSAPQAPIAPTLDAQAAAGEPAAPDASPAEKNAKIEAKPATPDTAQAQVTPQAQTQAQAPPVNTAQQTAPQAPVAVEQLPAAVQQAVAATIAPGPQPTTQATPRPTAKGAAQAGEAKAAPETHEGKPEAPAANAKPQAPKANAGNVVADAAPALQMLSSAPDGAQIEQTNALSATASQASTHVQHAATETGAQRAAPAAAQVGREIIRRFNGGSTNFELRLDPADLGRIEVRMEVTRDHRVTAVITADNPQALTELARNARDLEQQLQSAGLQLSDNGLSFDLRQGAQGGERDETSARAGGGEEALSEQPTHVARPIGIDRWRGVRVDMMV